jgi:hypothetical protein
MVTPVHVSPLLMDITASPDMSTALPSDRPAAALVKEHRATADPIDASAVAGIVPEYQIILAVCVPGAAPNAVLYPVPEPAAMRKAIEVLKAILIYLVKKKFA